ncbi:hypothetical protein HPB49_020975 [Dermacentor silvarum]|uniref:Uncharacterized protein n=1 Tax=Dermacentor silvarum TaxID=543639 RepID=A0ACB8CB59_DERSI|nr:hypothetical protein HPB49_020975 [Dermacentor silvarum]
MSRSPRSLRQHSRFHDRFVPYYPHLARQSPPVARRTVAIWTVMDSLKTSIGWVSRLPWELQPRPLIGESPELVPEPFRGLSSPNAIHPSGLLSIRQRKPASSAPSAACRRSTGGLIMPDLSTGPGSPQLRCIILAFSRQFPAPWRPSRNRAPPPSSVINAYQGHPPGAEALAPPEPQAPLEDLISLDLDP